MKTLRNITARRHGFEVQIKRRSLKWRAVVPYSHPDALNEAIKLRERFYKICGPISRRTPRSNTEVLGVSETIHWKGVMPLRCFIASVGSMTEGYTNKRFYYGAARTREEAFKNAVAYRAQAMGVQPETLLPQWL